jgi:hypothetical protein
MWPSEQIVANSKLETRARKRWNLSGHPVVTFLSVFILFSLLTVILVWAWMPDLHSTLIGAPGDNLQDFWNTWYAAVGSNTKSFFYTDLIRYPEGNNLYYQSFAYPQIFAIALISRITGNGLDSLAFLQNLSLLMSFPLAALGAFYLIRHLTRSTAGAIAGAFVFAFTPWHVLEVGGNAHVSMIEFIPFFVFFYLLACEKATFLRIFSAILFYALSAFSCWYYLFYIAYFIAFHTLYLMIRDRTVRKPRELIVGASCLIGVVAALSPVLIPMMRLAKSGAAVYAQGTDFYVADLFGYVAFPPSHFFASQHFPLHSFSLLLQRLNRRIGAIPNTVYLGLVNLAILFWAWIRSRRTDRVLLKYVLWGMAVFCVLASGDSLHVLGFHTIPLPQAILSKIPFFKNVRTPSRAIVFAYLFLAIGVGYATSLAWRERRRFSYRVALPVFAVLMLFDFYPFALATTPITCSPGLSLIHDDPDRDFGVLDLPSGYFENNFYMYFQAGCHARPIVQGTTSRVFTETLQNRLETRHLEIQHRQLTHAKVKYIVIHHPSNQWRFDWLRNLYHWHADDGDEQQYFKEYTAVYRSSEMTILQVY